MQSTIFTIFTAATLFIKVILIIFGVSIIGIVVGIIVTIIIVITRHRKSKATKSIRLVHDNSLGEILKAHRTRCNLTQEFVAESVGVSRQAVSKWERGDSDPSTSNLLELAKVYGVSTAELLESMK